MKKLLTIVCVAGFLMGLAGTSFASTPSVDCSPAFARGTTGILPIVPPPPPPKK